MSSYQYPDTNDTITCKFIDTKSDTTYWSQSEENVLQYALQALQTLSSPALLDIGCGMGRLFSTFLPYVSSLTGVEPDENRYAEAVKTASRLQSPHLQVLQGTLDTVKNIHFDAVLCSHIWQHLPFSVVQQMVQKLSSMLFTGALVFATTTFTSSLTDTFFLEEVIDGKHHSTPIDEATFELHTAQTGSLPVRVFAFSTIRNLCTSCGFALQAYYAYHFSTAYMPKPYSIDFDNQKNANKDFTFAKDMLYILRKL